MVGHLGRAIRCQPSCWRGRTCVIAIEVSGMPLYEYVCNGCECKFEVLRRMSQADAPVDCPQCQHQGARRAISRFAALRKGSDGNTSAVAGGGSCASCGASSCAGCQH